MRYGAINVRLLLLLAVILVPAGFIGSVALRTALTGGIEQVGDAYAVNLKAMSTFPFSGTAGTIEDVPEKWRELDGKKVILKGQMWDPSKVDGEVKTFDLVYSITECCFTGEPQIQHFIKATVPEGLAVEYAGNDRVQAVGTLRVDVTRDDTGRVDGVYHLDVAGVERL